MRQIVLDTETTGLDPEQGHRIIEIGCVELINRRLSGNNYHQYLQPDRKIDQAAIDVHGITDESLLDKPRFKEISADFIEYVIGAELIIHNAPFDTGFINKELQLQIAESEDGQAQTIEALCTVTDTLGMARKMHPGQRNNLDALCKRYDIDNSQRTLHGALLDSEILADVYLAMTGGQTGLFEDRLGASKMGTDTTEVRRLPADRKPGVVVTATDDELLAHKKWIDKLDESAGGKCVWTQMELEP